MRSMRKFQLPKDPWKKPDAEGTVTDIRLPQVSRYDPRYYDACRVRASGHEYALSPEEANLLARLDDAPRGIDLSPGDLELAARIPERFVVNKDVARWPVGYSHVTMHAQMAHYDLLGNKGPNRISPHMANFDSLVRSLRSDECQGVKRSEILTAMEEAVLLGTDYPHADHPFKSDWLDSSASERSKYLLASLERHFGRPALYNFMRMALSEFSSEEIVRPWKETLQEYCAAYNFPYVREG